MIVTLNIVTLSHRTSVSVIDVLDVCEDIVDSIIADAESREVGV